jgi:hypothetical protein
MRSDVFVYISGPMTANDGRTIEQNTADGVAVYLDLLKLGLPAFSPHLSGGFPSAWTALSHAEWIAYDKAVLDRCTHLLMMPRWESSKGARMEREYWMERSGGALTIAYSMRELVEQTTPFQELTP